MKGRRLPLNRTLAGVIPLSLLAVFLPAAAIRWNPELPRPVSPTHALREPAALSETLPPEFQETSRSSPDVPWPAEPGLVELKLAEPQFVAQLFYRPRQGAAPARPASPIAAPPFQTAIPAADIPGSTDIKPWEAAPQDYKLLGYIRDTDGTEYVYFKHRESGEIIKTEN